MKRFTLLILVTLVTIAFSLQVYAGPTYVTGNLTNEKAVWDSSGSPYIVEGDCKVPPGEILEIKPGTTIIIEENVTIEVLGSILALGEKNNHIVFKSSDENKYWNQISILLDTSNFPFAGKSRLRYCDFSNAKTALYLEIYGVNGSLETEIMNCSFSNCTEYGVLGKAKGEINQIDGNCVSKEPYLIPKIENCAFSSSNNGIGIWADGKYEQCLGSYQEYSGYAAPEIMNNVFSNIEEVAIKMIQDQNSRNSDPSIFNNLFINSNQAIKITEPYDDAEIKNNIFYGNDIAVDTATSTNLVIEYNCFFNNTENFQGIADNPQTSMNIYTDPLFINPSSDNYHLSDNSPCIDAGDPFYIQDDCFPPSLGTTLSDMGIYGGINACHANSLPNVPVLVSPENTDDNVDTNMTLEWTCDDPDLDDTLTYDIYLGTTNPPPLYITIQDDTTFTPDTLSSDTIYFWKVTVRDNADEETQSPVWLFRTAVEEEILQPPLEFETESSSSTSCFLDSML